MVGIKLAHLLLLLEEVVVAVPLEGGAVLLEGGAVLLEGASAGAAAAAHAAAAAASGAAVASVWAAHKEESWLHPGQDKQDVQADAEVAAASGAAAASAAAATAVASAASSDHAPAAAAAAASAAASAAHEPATVGPPPFGQHVQGEVVLVASASGAPSQRPGYCLQLHLQPVLQWLQVQT